MTAAPICFLEQCLHHAATLGVDHVIFVVGDTIGLTGGVLIEYDAPIRESYNKCVDKIYEDGLKWVYDEAVPVPESEIKAAIGKARVKMDYYSFMKSVYVWREMLKPGNLPLPPAIRIIPMQSQYWNDSKYGSDVKTQAAEMHRAVLPVESRQAKTVDRMAMLIFSDVHSLAKLFSAKADLSYYPDLRHYRDAGDHRYSMEKVLIESRKTFLSMMEVNQECLLDNASTALITDNASRLTRNQPVKNVDILQYTGYTPKSKSTIRKRYHDAYSVDDEPAKRFKNCSGHPVERVAVLSLKKKGTGAKGTCIGCEAQTNWWCVGCHTWACHDKSYPALGEPNFIRDLRDYWSFIRGKREKVRGNVVAKYTCFMHSHPKFLSCLPCSSSN